MDVLNVEPNRLMGEVEVDEILICGVKQGSKRGRGVSKSVVAIDVEIKNQKDLDE